MDFAILPELAVATLLLAVGWAVGSRSQKQRDDDRCYYCQMLREEQEELSMDDEN